YGDRRGSPVGACDRGDPARRVSRSSDPRRGRRGALTEEIAIPVDRGPTGWHDELHARVPRVLRLDWPRGGGTHRARRGVRPAATGTLRGGGRQGRLAQRATHPRIDGPDAQQGAPGDGLRLRPGQPPAQPGTLLAVRAGYPGAPADRLGRAGPLLCGRRSGGRVLGAPTVAVGCGGRERDRE